MVLSKSNKFESAFVPFVFVESASEALVEFDVESAGEPEVISVSVAVLSPSPHLQIHGGHGGVL